MSRQIRRREGKKEKFVNGASARVFALAFDVAGGDGGDIPVVFGAAEHMVALLNGHPRFDEAMRGEEHSGGRGEEVEEEEGTLALVSGWEGGRELSSSINFRNMCC